MRAPASAERWNRYVVAVPFTYRSAGLDAGPERLGWTRDLSEGGALVGLPEPLAVATDLEVRFRTPGGAPWLPARVIWGRPEPTSPGCHLQGLAFPVVTPAQAHILRALLARARPQGALRWYGGLAVSCQRLGEAGGTLRGRTRDLSEGGAAVWLPVPVPSGTLLRVRVETAFGGITAEAQVVWAEAEGAPVPGALFRHRLRFLRLGMASSLPLSLLLAGLR